MVHDIQIIHKSGVLLGPSFHGDNTGKMSTILVPFPITCPSFSVSIVPSPGTEYSLPDRDLRRED